MESGGVKPRSAWRKVAMTRSGPEGPEFAPLYDIVCTRVYPNLAAELAMTIGGAWDAQAVWEKDFVQLAGELDLAPESMLAEAHRQKEALRRRLAARPAAGKGAEVARFVEERCADVDCWQDPRPRTERPQPCGHASSGPQLP